MYNENGIYKHYPVVKSTRTVYRC